MPRTFLLVVFSFVIASCTQWGSSSGWERSPDPDEPNIEVQDDETAGSYTPLESEAEADD